MLQNATIITKCDRTWSPCALFITLYLVFYDFYIRELCYFTRRPWSNSIFLFKLPFLSTHSGWSVKQLLDKRHLVKFTAYTSTIAFFPVSIMSTSCNYDSRLRKAFKTESTRKLNNFNFQWTKTLYQNNSTIWHSFFFFSFFKGYRHNKLSVT